MGVITETYEKHAHLTPEKTAVQTPFEKVTYQAWQKKVWQTANWLDSLQQSNHTLGILMPNGIPFLQLFTSAAAAGWTAVVFDPKWTLNECQVRMGLARPSILVTTKELYPKIKPFHPHVLLWEECSLEINRLSTYKMNLVDDQLPFYMGFTSGTTGHPKAFIRAHSSWTSSFDCTRKDFHIDQHDTVLIPGSLIHSHFLYGAISTLYWGGTVHLLEKFSPKQVISLLEKESVTVLYVVPTMIAALLKEQVTIEKPIKILSSGAKWEEHTKQQIRKSIPHSSMYEFYGASELSFVTFLNEEDYSRKTDSVGKPCQRVEIQIRRPDGQSAQAYETGKIYVRSPMLFKGYLEHSDHDAIHKLKSIADENGWVSVGDMGYVDEDNYLYLSGREKNMILYGAINIFPEEIEKVIGSHSDVEEVAVIGLSDSYWGQIIAAVIKGSADKRELKKLCREKLASYKVPRKWIFVEELPYTTSGKISRPQVKKLIEGKVSSH
nr:AMP-binding protein [Neobacillus sp. Marseille-Q6967]